MKKIYCKPLTSIEEAFYSAFILAESEDWDVEGEGAPGTGGGSGPPSGGGMGSNQINLWDDVEEEY